MVLLFFFISLFPGIFGTENLSQDSFHSQSAIPTQIPPDAAPLDSLDHTCTFQYSLLAKEEPITFLENLLQPIPLEQFLVDILQKQPAVARRNNPHYYGNGTLLHMNDIATILKRGRKQHNPKKRIKYLEDWKLVKRTMSNGEWWTGIFHANASVSVQEAQDAFSKGGFTLIIKEMQGLWSPIHHAAWLVEAALGWRVNVNLYMSPAGSQGFEAHYDWMDGLIMQLYGKKNWTIYDPPMAVYPRPDHVKRPTLDFFRLARQEDSQSSKPTNVPPQEFVLSAGDLVYVPRGVVHEATATLPTSEEDEELSMHLTFGVETATHYSVEIFLHHFFASRDESMKTFSSLMTSPPTLRSNGKELSFLLSNDHTEVALYLPQAEGTVEDFLHLLLSAVASYSSPILRGAVGVTVLMMDIPQLNPFYLFPFAAKELLRSLHLPTILKFLIQRGFVKISVAGAWGNDEAERMLFPGLDSSQLVYQSADFSCRYLDTFLSNRSLSSDRMLTLHLTDSLEGDIWAQLLESNETHASRPTFSRTKAAEFIDVFGNWTAAEDQLAGLLTRLLESTANVVPRPRGVGTEVEEVEEQREDEIFCKAWRGMMMSVKEEKSQRKKGQVAALKAAGQKLREVRGTTGAGQSPSAAGKEPLETTSVAESGVYSEL